MRWDGTVILEDRQCEDWSVVFDDRITYVGESAGAPGVPDALVPFISPGLIDVHSHGGGGESFPDSDSLAAISTAAGEHLKHGTTTMLASTVTAEIPTLESRAALLAEACRQGIVAGIHFEGPFVSTARCGAQDPRYIIPPSPGDMAALVTAADGWARSMTLAPEFIDAGSLEVLVAAGALPSWGHTDAGPEQTRRAIELGVSLLGSRRASVTHLFNGMKPLHHRDPGPIAEFLAFAARGEVVLEIICDGVHVDPLVVRSVVETVGRENCILITDSMAATGLGDGTYSLGPQKVRVDNGTATLLEGDSIAGGTAHLIDCVRTAVNAAGISLVDAIWMASTQGAATFGWSDRGRIGRGLRADLVALDDSLSPIAICRAGVPVVGV